MRLDTKAGEKIKFTGKGGYDYQLENALQFLTIGEKYTFSDIQIDSWSSAVQLEEFPNEWFNSAQFENVKK